MSNKIYKRISGIIILLLSITALLCGCSTQENENKYSSLDDLADKRIGVITGMITDVYAKERWEDPELVYLTATADCIPALTTGKIDCILGDEPWALYLCSANDELTIIDEYISNDTYAFVFSKTEDGERLVSDFNLFMEQITENGELKRIQDCWVDSNPDNHPTLDLSALPCTNGVTIHVVCDSSNPPFEFMENGYLGGMDVEIVYRYCEARGYGLEIADANFDSLIPGVVTGKYDMAISSFSITPEREESVNFSLPVYEGGTVAVILKKNSADAESEDTDESFLESIAESFAKTFVRENRWMLFINGIITTLTIAVTSLLFGTLSGFGAYMWVRQGKPLSSKVMKFSCWLITGMPEVLLLLIFYYIVFGHSSINGTWVAVIAFSLVICVNVFEMFTGGVAAVDGNQLEAALALGYSPNAAFYRIIFPQALEHMLPGYYGTIVSLLKSTAVVGYLAVQDLTKVSDIIRSKTYEPFFPLIVTAVIYFILSWLLQRAVMYIQKRFLPIRHTRASILRGIDTKKEETK